MRGSFVRTLIAVLLALTLSACGAAVDLGGLARQITDTPGSAPVSASDKSLSEAVQQTIERANQAQATAFNTGDATLMRDTATASFYTDLVRTNRDLAAAGVRRIELVSTDFVSVSASGANATATTLEEQDDRGRVQHDRPVPLVELLGRVGAGGPERRSRHRPARRLRDAEVQRRVGRS